MKQNCPNCNQPLPLKLTLRNNPFKEFTCPNCSAVLKFKMTKFILSLVLVGLFFLIVYTLKRDDLFWYLYFGFIIAYFGINFLPIPNQIKVEYTPQNKEPKSEL